MARYGRPAARSRFSDQPVVATCSPNTPTIAVPSTGRSRTASPAMTSATRRPCRLAVLASGTRVDEPSTASIFSTASPTARHRGVGGAQLLVDEDAAALTDAQAGLLRERGVGAHADGGDDEVGRDRSRRW